jgi:hypothetical protein
MTSLGVWGSMGICTPLLVINAILLFLVGMSPRLGVERFGKDFENALLVSLIGWGLFVAYKVAKVKMEKFNPLFFLNLLLLYVISFFVYKDLGVDSAYFLFELALLVLAWVLTVFGLRYSSKEGRIRLRWVVIPAVIFYWPITSFFYLKYLF